jgi:hypothetical protein
MRLILPHDYPEAPPKGLGPSMLPVADLEVTTVLKTRLFCHKNFSSKHPPARWRDMRKYTEKRLAA